MTNTGNPRDGSQLQHLSKKKKDAVVKA